MPVVNMLDAKSNLSKLVDQVESGAASEIIIARNGKPAAKLVPLGPSQSAVRRLGLLAGRFAPMRREDFDAANSAIAKLFGAAKSRR
ncbi:MAG: type II toxin-antitoxin system prevent-host-death family antitoxin [Beijerinckiaceae bacterium]